MFVKLLMHAHVNQIAGHRRILLRSQLAMRKCRWKLNNYGVGTPVFLGASAWQVRVLASV